MQIAYDSIWGRCEEKGGDVQAREEGGGDWPVAEKRRLGFWSREP